MSELDQLLVLIKRFEGCSLHAYICPAGVVTIGWGATGGLISLSSVWTQEEADARLVGDATRFLIGAMKLCPNLRSGQLVAAADFAYNLGLGRLKGSTLRQRLLQEDWNRAKEELLRWSRSGGKVLPGLLRRRTAEANLF